jgi:hypothetical protein
MKIVPLAFDSLGTRSMSTLVETDNVRILIDPGVSLAPRRFGYPPHPLELERLEEHWREIVKRAKRAEVLVITHYHYDHHNPSEGLEIYRDKTVLIKHPTEHINFSQRGRAKFFLEQIKGLPKKLEYCDGKRFEFGETKLVCSSPVFHGTNPKLGYVVEVLVDDGERKFIHTSDVEGPSVADQAGFILEHKPNVLFVDGPMTCMLGFRYSYQSLEASVENLVRIIKACPLDALVLDHHFLRELKWRKRVPKVFEIAEKKEVKVQTAAEFAGKFNDLLEARRVELFKKHPPKPSEVRELKFVE